MKLLMQMKNFHGGQIKNNITYLKNIWEILECSFLKYEIDTVHI